jgi:hypothetical protein
MTRKKKIKREIEDERKRMRKEVAATLTEQQCSLIAQGRSPIQREKLKLLYFSGIKRNYITLTKAMLKTRGIGNKDIINMSWLGNTILKPMVPISR